MNMKKVMVTGHRPNKLGGYSPNPTQTWVRSALNSILQKMVGKVEVISGMALGVDQWFALEALKLGIPVHAYIPCDGQEKMWPQSSQDIFHEILSQCSTQRVISKGAYAGWKMQVRNIAMVDDADLCIAVWDGTTGGTGNCVKYIREKKPSYIRIDPKEQRISKGKRV